MEGRLLPALTTNTLDFPKRIEGHEARCDRFFPTVYIESQVERSAIEANAITEDGYRRRTDKGRKLGFVRSDL